MTQQTIELARLIGRAIGECPCAVLPVMDEILAAAALVSRSRRMHPTPIKTVVFPDGHEIPLRHMRPLHPSAIVCKSKEVI